MNVVSKNSQSKDASHMAKFFFKEIIRLYVLPTTIMFD